MNSAEYLLKQIDWQWFFTLTWRDSDLGSINKREADVDEYLRSYTARRHVPFSECPTVIRWECGESTQRPHCHVLLTGLPIVPTRRKAMKLAYQWYRLHGLARVRPWHAGLRSAVGEYFGKNLDRLDKHHVSGSMTSANEYELAKFNRADRLVFNQALWAQLQAITGTAFEVAPST